MPTTWPSQALGSSTTRALVFLHGFLGRGADWLPVAKAFSSAYRCLLPDLPGHGANLPLDPDIPLTFDLLADGLAAALAAARVNRPVLAGYSLGGRLALHFACRFPDRLSALVLESASPGLRSAHEREIRRLLDDERAAQLLQTGLPAFLDGWYRADLWSSLRERPDLLADLIQGRSGIPASGAAKALADLSPGRMEPLWDCLPGLSIPVLLVSGELDTKYTAIAAEATALVPGAAHARIPGAGHNVHLEQPGAFSRALRQFLSRKSAREEEQH